MTRITGSWTSDSAEWHFCGMSKFSSSLLACLSVACAAIAQSPAPAVAKDSVRKTPTVAVMDFEGRGLPAEQALTLADRFRAELASCGGFRQVERSRMDEILREQGFQQSGCTSTECAVQTGRILGVERIVSGSVSKIGETWTVHAREIDVGTAEILKTAIVDERGVVDNLLTSGMSRLAERLVGTCGDAGKDQASDLAASLPRINPLQIAPAPPLPVLPGPPVGPSHSVRKVPFQIAFISPLAAPAGEVVDGVGISLIYGRLESLRGIQAGVLNHVVGTSTGIQAGALNVSADNLGMQAGAYNSADELRGMQAGVVNVSTSSKGMQAGLVNITGNCRCVQFGLVNIWKSPDGATWFFPFIGGLY